MEAASQAAPLAPQPLAYDPAPRHFSAELQPLVWQRSFGRAADDRGHRLGAEVLPLQRERNRARYAVGGRYTAFPVRGDGNLRVWFSGMMAEYPRLSWNLYEPTKVSVAANGGR